MLIWNELARCLCMVIWVPSLKRTRQMSLYVLVIELLVCNELTRCLCIPSQSAEWRRWAGWRWVWYCEGWRHTPVPFHLLQTLHTQHTTLVFFQLKSRSPTTNTCVQWPMVIQYKSSIENSKHSSKFSMTVKSLFFSWISINKIERKMSQKKENKQLKRVTRFFSVIFSHEVVDSERSGGTIKPGKKLNI